MKAFVTNRLFLESLCVCIVQPIFVTFELILKKVLLMSSETKGCGFLFFFVQEIYDEGKRSSEYLSEYTKQKHFT
jgi:hypothetical protein